MWVYAAVAQVLILSPQPTFWKGNPFREARALLQMRVHTHSIQAPGHPPQNLRGAKETNPGIIHMEMKRLSPLDSESLSLGEERKWLPCTLLKSDLPAFLQGKKVNLWLRAHSKSCLQPRAVCLSAFLKSLKKSTHLRLRTFKKSPFLMTSLLRHSFFRKGAVLWFCA